MVALPPNMFGNRAADLGPSWVIGVYRSRGGGGGSAGNDGPEQGPL